MLGHNNPPTDAITLAADPMEAVRQFLKNIPVIATEDEIRDAKAAHDAAVAALKTVEAERKTKVAPLNAELKAINEEYHKWHSTSGKPGIWDRQVADLKSRMTKYAREEERKRHKAEEAARQAAVDAAEKARALADAEEQARDMAASGVCDVDLAGAIKASHEAGQEAIRADWTARRAEGETKVRIVGGSGKALSLKDREILTVTDWKAAIEAIGLVDRIAATIIAEARAYREAMGDLPPGVTADFERGL